MKKLLVATILLVSSEYLLADSISEILSTPPEQAAEKAFNSGDKRMFMVPGCFNGVPGYRGGPPKHRPMQLWRSCEELFTKEDMNRIKKLSDWAEKYNKYIVNQLQ